MIALGLLWVAAAVYLGWMILCLIGVARLRPGQAAARPAVSVIVPARNEAATLPACLTALAVQSYRDFEVIVVDDHSTDGTPAIAAAWADNIVSGAATGCGA